MLKKQNITRSEKEQQPLMESFSTFWKEMIAASSK